MKTLKMMGTAICFTAAAMTFMYVLGYSIVSLYSYITKITALAAL